VFNPISEFFKKFDATDLYYVLSEKKEDNRIIIIDIGNANRKEIAQLLLNANEKNPKVIGLDIFFSEECRSDDDSLLIEALNGTNNLVLVYHSENDYKDYGQFGVLNTHYGYDNLSDDRKNRYIDWKYQHNDTIEYAFSTVVAQLYDENTFLKLKQRNKKKEIIHYNKSFETNIKEINSINWAKEDFTNKIVLIGNTKSKEDLHEIPMGFNVDTQRSLLSGIEIYATVISMIIDGVYIKRIPRWLDYVMAFILCYCCIILLSYLYLKHITWYSVSTKLIQFLLLIISMFIVLGVYNLFRLKIYFSISLLAIILSADTIIFYDFIIKVLYKKFKFKSIFINTEEYKKDLPITSSLL
jgi:CHASE2 domain-containing sensor protein